ncbi:MAG: glucose-6-phosphate isomerase, partial [Planctomycetota bacterium]
MAANSDSLDHFLRWRATLADPPVDLDLSLAGLGDEDLESSRGSLEEALRAMARLEAGGIANPDENRMVGHYWLRAPGLAPDADTSERILETITSIEEFADRVQGAFQDVLLVGIGGSALGPMLVADALSSEDDSMRIRVLDNTDPDGIERRLASVESLAQALVLVVSKSGTTPETRNTMLEIQRAFRDAGVAFADHAVAITGADSPLAQLARDEGWVATFPMWDWVGGRTSLWSAVGLLPAALMGLDVRALLAGAAAMDGATRNRDLGRNPAALLALFWHHEGGGTGARNMVVLPYKDRLLLFSRYLQQLVMESLGKQRDRQGNIVEQGLTVYGNKGSTDQHAFVQQLRDGRHDFFAVFVRVLQDREGHALQVEPGVTTGDYLDGFWQGTRQALFEKRRHSATITLDRLDERSLGALIALFERTVGIYAELIDVNAYHQPGVESGKQASAAVLELQGKVWAELDESPRTCVEIAAALAQPPGRVWPILQHLAQNRHEVHKSPPHDHQETRFRRS